MDQINRIGLQLYTVRTEMEKDFEATLEQVAAIGYQEVEFAGYFKHSPNDVRHILDQCGLSAPSAHVDYHSIVSDWHQVVEAAQIIGHEYLVNPLIDPELLGEPDIWKRAADTFNRAGDFSQQAGIQFAYHNHFFEFFPLNAKLPYEILLEECDPELVKMEMDFCWIASVGQDPFKYFKLYPGRFPLAHLKQLKKTPVHTAGEGIFDFFERALPDITEVGEGVIDWRNTLSQSSRSGIRHYFVEHDTPPSPFDSAKMSYEYLKKLHF